MPVNPRAPATGRTYWVRSSYSCVAEWWGRARRFRSGRSAGSAGRRSARCTFPADRCTVYTLPPHHWLLCRWHRPDRWCCRSILCNSMLTLTVSFARSLSTLSRTTTRKTTVCWSRPVTRTWPLVSDAVDNCRFSASVNKNTTLFASWSASSYSLRSLRRRRRRRCHIQRRL